MKTRQLDILRFALAISDILLLNTCLVVGLRFANNAQPGHLEGFYQSNALPVTAIWLLSSSFFKLYNEYTLYKSRDILKITWRSLLLFSIIFQVYSLLSVTGYQKEFMLSFHLILVISFTVSRLSAFFLIKNLNLDFGERRASILAIASVGGHWVELLRLMPLFKSHKVAFISNKADLADTVAGSSFYVVPDANRGNIVNLIRCFLAIVKYVIVLRPRVIITTGAAPGLMGIAIGRLMGIKTIWIDSIANVDELSLSGHIATRIADKVYTQWDHLANAKITYSGSVL